VGWGVMIIGMGIVSWFCRARAFTWM